MSPVALVRRHPLGAFFVAVYAASALGLLVIGLPQLGNGPVPGLGTALALFP